MRPASRRELDQACHEGEILRRGNLPDGMLDGIVCLDDRSLVRVELGRVDRLELAI